MKALKSILVGSFFLLTISSAIAQIGTNGYYGYGGGGPTGPTAGNLHLNEKSAETIEKERIESTNKSVETLKKELNLDELQLVIIRKEVDESNKKIYAIVKDKEKSPAEITSEIFAINEIMDTKITTFLNEEQKVKYKVIVETRKERMNKVKAKK
jgi:hypothetical protein